MHGSRPVTSRRRLARVAGILLAAVVLVAGCSTEEWRQLELGDVLHVRGQRLLALGGDTLVGGANWAVFVSLPQRVSIQEVRRARFGVGTAARWTLMGDVGDAAAWPVELELERAAWQVEIEAGGSITRHRFDVAPGQRLMRSLPCDAKQCGFEFIGRDAHRDVFTFEAVAGRDAALDAWLDRLDRGLQGTVRLALHVEVGLHGGSLSKPVIVMVPMAPTGALLEFRP